ncbi:conserved hypothetical protein [Magnetococcus marinus MC-1]|uniref:SGNH hydrolase-type esterase domain-containing protein n=1 Tax=Magnetococcus marinus (strain ATCC BAA-1437 / JCM 17883 / MC-1) TaxID=156889 RepID=A0LCN0_MAGMM|nr:GDSL-type esterase/lipase family protein [Magnetococcus marinus]ABK45723.1 conserved hypothetical protein [Magnetococcus marinus MC-1]
MMRVLFVGDRFVAGVGDPAYAGWVGRLCAASRADLTLSNLGVRQQTSVEIAQRWHAEAVTRWANDAPYGLVFAFGVNDVVEQQGMLRVGHEESLAVTRLMLSQAQTLGPVLRIGPPPVADSALCARLQGLDAGFAGVAQGLGVPYLSVLGPLLRHETWMQQVALGDGAYPTGEGYAALAELEAG